MKSLGTILIWLCSCHVLCAQILIPCPSNSAPPSDLCAAACVYCSVDGITGSTSGYSPQAVVDWCGSIENEQWLSFTASCTSIALTVIPSSCAHANGVQIGIFTTCSGQPIACNGGAAGFGDTPITTLAQTTPGQQYLICIDGWAGDVCNYTLKVELPGCDVFSHLGTTLPIHSLDTLCATPITATVPAVAGAVAYVWNAPAGVLLNGEQPPITTSGQGANKVTITHAGVLDGAHKICVKAIGTCGNVGNEVCKEIVLCADPVSVSSPEKYIYLLPNPASETVRVLCSECEEADEVEFFSSDGRLVKSLHDYPFGSDIDLTDLPVGVYTLRVQRRYKGVEVFQLVRVE